MFDPFVLQRKMLRDERNRLYRKQSSKKMTVEMFNVKTLTVKRGAEEVEEPIVWPPPQPWPFVWPDMPENKAAWDKDILEATTKDQQKRQKEFRADVAEQPKPDARLLADRARDLLSGKARWHAREPALGGLSKVASQQGA